MKTRTNLKPETDPPGAAPQIEATSQTQSGRSTGTPFKCKRILVPVDFSEGSFRALDYGLSLAESLRATVIVLHVVEPAVHLENYLTAPANVDETNQNLLAAGRERIEAVSGKRLGHGVPLESLVRMGHAHSEIVDTAKALAADLIVLAAHGRTGPKGSVLGSTAERVLRMAACPVLTVRLRDTVGTR